MEKSTYICSKCGSPQEFEYAATVDAALDTEMKVSILDGSIFIRECPVCGNRNLVVNPFVYRDRNLGVLICLSPENLAASGEIPGFPTARQVRTAGEMIEKIKIFDAALDDVAVEMCKMVTSQELGKDADLKFLCLGGADNTITLTYPENGEMQMLEIGFNIYEDCAGIVSRNPVLHEKAKGLVRVDQAWLSSFFG